MRKFKNNAALRTEGISGAGKSSVSVVSKENTNSGFTEVKPDVANNTSEEKKNDSSRMFFLNAMNQYEGRLNREFSE